MLDRYVSMRADGDPRVESASGLAKTTIRDQLIEEKHHESAYASAELRCQREVSRSAYDCAIAAPGPNEWEACVQ